MKANYLKDNYFIVAILVLASFLRFYHIDFQSIWVDEILSMNDANPKLSLKEFYDGIMFWEYIPHLFFLLLRFAFEIFGYTTMVGRVFSALLGILGVYAIYLLGKEIFNRKAGLIAALLLAVNIFHISYSQEIRPYGMLFLFTTLSFYRLIIFIRLPTIKNAVFYGIMTGLIINSHFFGIITIFAQCLIILYFLYIHPKEGRKKFLLNAAIAGAVVLILFIPAIKPMLRVSGIQSFWLQKPGPEAFTIMFKEFFGTSEMVLTIINIVVVYYFINLFKERISLNNYYEITGNKTIYGFIVIFVWVFISILIPLLRSHLDIPMVLNRYFINVLPALILVIGIGVAMVNNKPVRNLIVIALVCFSLTDIFAVKKYYSTVAKSQMRELTIKIKEKTPNKIKIVAFWGWLVPYFFQDNPNTTVITSSFEDYIKGLKDGVNEPTAFWYMDANSRPYALDGEMEEYLKENFKMKLNLEYYDAWARYYVPKRNIEPAKQ